VCFVVVNRGEVVVDCVVNRGELCGVFRGRKTCHFFKFIFDDSIVREHQMIRAARRNTRAIIK
jgi:hypothetical protein